MNLTHALRRRLSIYFSLIVLGLASGLFPAAAQHSADSLRKAYDFKGAVDLCRQMVEKADSLGYEEAEAELILSQNGLSMTEFCSQPNVVARHRFSIKDFFLFFPMQDKSWRAVPNQLDSLGGPFVKATYVPDDATTIYYSAPDADGIRNIYRTHFKDSIWSAPALINENITSSSDEIFPVVSSDGKTLHFASKGLYGMGGYDLYVSTWNEKEQDWDPPTNLGFPYSSPYDDFLYINSEDGLYSIFASNRECSSDSVYVYVLEFDSMPIRKSVQTVDALKALSRLDPQENLSKSGNTSAIQGTIPEDENVMKYKEAMFAVRQIRDSISAYNASLDKLRAAYKSDEEVDKQALSAEILQKELALPAKQKELSAALKALQKIEMDFLASGIVIDPDKLQAEADREVVGTSSNYVFSKNSLGPALSLVMEAPDPEFDYSFKILPEGQFAEDNTLPAGLVYQIQLFSISRKAGVREIKGLSPVFERQTNGRHIYSAGLFNTYADVLSNLNKVKKQGFKTAMIVAFKDGKQISINAARSIESENSRLFKIRIYPEDGQTLPEGAINAIRERSDKDILRLTDGAATVYEVGPFESKEECEQLSAVLLTAGVSSVSVSEIE